MKKSIISTVAALGILAAPIAGQASAAQPDKVQANVKVYYYQAGDFQNFNDWCKQFASKSPNWNHNTQNNKGKQPASEQVEKPAEKPAPTNPQESQKGEKKPAEQQNSQLSQYEQKVVELTNAERAKNGLAPLKVDAELSKVAREKSRDMSANNYFDHNSLTYGSPFDMMKKFGISYRAAGENIAQGQRTPEEVVNAWMNSSGHRENIMSKDFTHIGVGYVAEGNYWTQQFIGK